MTSKELVGALSLLRNAEGEPWVTLRESDAKNLIDEIERLRRSEALLLEIQKSMADCIGTKEGQTFEDRAEELIVTEVQHMHCSAHEPPAVPLGAIELLHKVIKEGGGAEEWPEIADYLARESQPPPGDASPALDYADAIAERRAAQPPGSLNPPEFDRWLETASAEKLREYVRTYTRPSQPPADSLPPKKHPMPRPDEYILRINGRQASQLADFADDPDTSMVLRYYGEDRIEPGKYGEPMPAGLYAWYEEYPEEGQLLLQPTPTKSGDTRAKEQRRYRCMGCGKDVAECTCTASETFAVHSKEQK